MYSIYKMIQLSVDTPHKCIAAAAGATLLAYLLYRRWNQDPRASDNL